MATPAIEALKKAYPEARFTIIGSTASAPLFTHDPAVTKIIVDRSKKNRFRLLGTWRLAKEVGRHDKTILFTNSLLSALLAWWSGSPTRLGFAREGRSIFLTHAPKMPKSLHQVERYHQLVNTLLPNSTHISNLMLHLSQKPKRSPRRLGINPGAAYGSAKRWDEQKFAAVAAALAERFDELILMGGAAEVPITEKIEQQLSSQGIPATNLAGKTSIPELMETIASLSLMITNDSGPMHIATAFQVPLVAIFGPTDATETSPWNHPGSKTISISLDCAPCKQRTCPLKHHRCMEEITPAMVLEAANALLEKET